MKSVQTKTTTQFLTTEDVCQMFDVCRTTLYNWRKGGLLPFHRMGRKVYFLEHEITEAVKKIDFSDLSSFPYRNNKWQDSKELNAYE
jgi:excisionase family DNA binding protein